MNVLNHRDISELIEHRSPTCVSLYMPTHRSGRERQQDAIRLRNLVGQAREQVEADAEAELEAMLKPLAGLPADEAFWKHRSDGLACFCAPEFFRAYRVPLRLDEQLFVNERFHIRPLLPLIHSDARIHILALTQESVRLFEATKYSIREVELPEVVPTELDDAEQSLQFHSHRAPSQGRGETAAALYHGHGGAADRSKTDTLRYFQLVDETVSRVLRGHDAPLVLACVSYLAPLYQKANSYSNLVDEPISGNPELWTENELRDYAWKLIEPEQRRKQEQAWERYQQASGKNCASSDLRSVVLAAEHGRVDSLFLVRGEHRWGRVDPQLNAVHVCEREQQGEDLLDYAAVKTVSNGGEVFVMDSIPDCDAAAAATFRYPLDDAYSSPAGQAPSER